MSDTPNQQSSDQSGQNDPNESAETEQRNADPDRIVDVMDLVYKGGYSRDPQEILGNPAVAPQMLSEGRDLRVDLFADAEETFSTKPSDSPEQPNK
jgi:hypothetical protein